MDGDPHRMGAIGGARADRAGDLARRAQGQSSRELRCRVGPREGSDASGLGELLRVRGAFLAVPRLSVVILITTTLSVNVCFVFGATPLLAVMVMVEVPVAVAVPESTPPLLRLTPPGRVPVLVKVIVVG